MYQPLSNQLPALFCKPTNTTGHPCTWTKFYPQLKATLQFRPLDLKTDLHAIHSWVNQPYALQYWQMNGHFSQLYAIYQCMVHNPYAQSFIGLYNGTPICQFDIYSVAADELSEHINVEPHDCGFHLLMAPNNKPVSGLTVALIEAFLQFYFSFPEAKRMYAEPDITNLKSITLLEKSGFQKIKTVEMSYKQAHIYTIQKTTYENKQ